MSYIYIPVLSILVCQALAGNFFSALTCIFIYLNIKDHNINLQQESGNSP